LAALIEGNGNYGHVFLVSENKSARQEIKIEIIRNNMMLVSSGLSPDDLIITEGAHYVKDGSQIFTEKQ